MKFIRSFATLIVASFFMMSCGAALSEDAPIPVIIPEEGGTEAGNPNPVRQLVGEVPAADIGCMADTMVLTTELLDIQAASIGTDCRFESSVHIGVTYSFELEQDGQVIAQLMFPSENGDSVSPFLRVLDGDGPIDLGLIQIEQLQNDIIATAAPLSPLEKEDSVAAFANDDDSADVNAPDDDVNEDHIGEEKRYDRDPNKVMSPEPSYRKKPIRTPRLYPRTVVPINPVLKSSYLSTPVDK